MLVEVLTGRNSRHQHPEALSRYLPWDFEVHCLHAALGDSRVDSQR